MHGSGEIVLAFSTANQVPRETRKMVYRVKILLDQRLDPLYEAVIEATEEAILNALCMARDMDGVNGNLCRALPLDDVKELVAAWQAVSARQAAAPATPAPRTPPADGAGRIRAAAPAARPTAVRGAEGMASPARPPGAAGVTRIERPDVRSDPVPARLQDEVEPAPPAAPPGRDGRGGTGEGSPQA
jgi:D-aminopeptidase